ncbi:hypothetical protein [Clostridioides sp. GD02404]
MVCKALSDKEKEALIKSIILTMWYVKAGALTLALGALAGIILTMWSKN